MENETSVYIYMCVCVCERNGEQRGWKREVVKKGWSDIIENDEREREKEVMRLQEIYRKKRGMKWEIGERLECIDRKGKKKEKRGEKKNSVRKEWQAIRGLNVEWRREWGDHHEDSPVTHINTELASFHTPPPPSDTGASKLQFFLGHSVNWNPVDRSTATYATVRLHCSEVDRMAFGLRRQGHGFSSIYYMCTFLQMHFSHWIGKSR